MEGKKQQGLREFWAPGIFFQSKLASISVLQIVLSQEIPNQSKNLSREFWFKT